MSQVATARHADPHDAPSAAPGGPLLVAVGGERPVDHVVAAARLLAERLGAPVHPVAVAEAIAARYLAPTLEPIAPERITEQRAAVRADAERALRAGLGDAVRWRLDVVPGPRARTIARLAAGRRARLIVMGLGRHDAVDRMLGDEVTVQTARLADRPVLGVAPGLTALPRRAVAAIDFSAASVRAAEEALAMLPAGGTLTLAHVRPELDELVQPAAEVWLASHHLRLTELFERIRAELAARAPRVTVETTILAGVPADEVLGLAARVGAALVATGSTGRGLFARLVVGSVATQLLRRSPVSVLVVPTPPASEIARVEALLAIAPQGTDASEWPAMAARFSERNAGRPTRLDLDDPAVGARLVERGYALVGATYEPRDGRLELLLGVVRTGARRLTHTVGAVRELRVLSDAVGRDEALRVRHDRGQTVLAFRD